jgi:hypothetical protein
MPLIPLFALSHVSVKRLLEEVHTQHSCTQKGDLQHGEKDVGTTADDVVVTTHSSASSMSGRDCHAPSRLSFPSSTTLAVRGATYARPEGYCLCWDQDLLLDRMYYSGEQERSQQDSRAVVRQQEWEEIRRRRNRRRCELQRQVLPVILWSKRQRAPHHSQTTTTTKKQLLKEEESALGIYQPCIQFLNIDSSHAVRLFTPPFEQGPISTPLTVFCVAVATEDGCFFSGLRRRFEVGHLYPGDEDSGLIERSPVCISAEYDNRSRPLQSTRTDTSNDKDDIKRLSSSAMGQRTSSNVVFQNSDDSSCDMSYMESAAGDPGWKCDCPLSGLGDLLDEEEAASAQPESSNVVERTSQVCRGRLGPGTWHCYVAIFHGDQSEIRIDGVAEPVTCNPQTPFSSRAYLDGITIGADHTFDMSLCFGQGSDGEGEGAMAELAIFKGHFNETDLMAVEAHLMTKHGIPHPNRPSEEIAADDEYARLAHGLLAAECDPGSSDNSTDGRTTNLHSKPVPLRYLTKLRGVAWKQSNPVTGEAISVQRIGTKAGNSSSDW